MLAAAEAAPAAAAVIAGILENEDCVDIQDDPLQG